MKLVRRSMVCIAAIIGFPVLTAAETHRFTPTVYHPTYSFAHPPALRIKPGDRVITKTIDAGGGANVVDPRFTVVAKMRKSFLRR